MSSVHVVPVNDLIDHNTESDECICGPRIELVEGDGDGWLIVHNSLDGRELAGTDNGGNQ